MQTESQIKQDLKQIYTEESVDMLYGIFESGSIPLLENIPYLCSDGYVIGQCTCPYHNPIVWGEDECMYCGRAFTPEPDVVAKAQAMVTQDAWNPYMLDCVV